MRQSVTAAWPAMCRRFEGVTRWMYLDTKGLVTTGIGFLINTLPEAQALPWLTKDGAPATQNDIKKEWTRVKNHQEWKKYNGLNSVWVKSAQLTLAQDTVDALLIKTTLDFWKQLGKDIPNLEAAPADAQLAIMDEAWQNGKYFLKAGTVWTGTRSAVLIENWSGAASHVPGDDKSDRKIARKRLFMNAWAVKQLKLDYEKLWDTAVPQVPVKPTTPVPTPPVDPPKETPPTVPVTPPKEPTVADKVKHNAKYGDYIEFRGENFPVQTVEKLKAIPTYAGVIQGGLSFAAPSANTHAGLGVGDLSVRGMTKDEVWDLCEELWEVNILPAPRGFVKDSFQGKSVSNINDGNEHIHFLDLDEIEHMHPEAKAQVKEMLAGGDGLRGNAHFTGPTKKFQTKWSDSMYNPKNVKLEPGVFYVQSKTLQGLNAARVKKEDKVQNDRISYVKKIKRWGRWNVVTVKNTFFAEADAKQTYLAPSKVGTAEPAPEPTTPTPIEEPPSVDA